MSPLQRDNFTDALYMKPMHQSADVVVIGGGPAGSAAARLLAQWGHEVVLLSRASHGRPLAESLPPSCTKLFDQLGVRSEIDGAGFIRATGNTVHWAGAETRAESFDAGLCGYQVPRDRFDEVLLSAAARAGVAIHRDASARDVTRVNDEWAVAYEKTTDRQTVRARWVLDCSGRSGVVARRGWRQTESATRTTAIVGIWSRDEWPIADESHTLVESFDGGWAWSVPVSMRERFFTVMLDPSVTELRARGTLGDSYVAELARTSMMRDLIDGATLIASPWGCDASSYSAVRTSDEGILLVGDAASFVDPLSSFGVKKALASAWLASIAVHTSTENAAMATHAMALFDDRERAMYEHLQRQSAALSRDASTAHDTDFWRLRRDGSPDDAAGEVDLAALRGDPRIRSAFDEIRRRPLLRLRASDSLEMVDRAVIRGRNVVLDQHLRTPTHRDAVRYYQNVDLVLLAKLAVAHEQVPDLYDAYNRAAPTAPLPEFLSALSTLVGLEMLVFA